MFRNVAKAMVGKNPKFYSLKDLQTSCNDRIAEDLEGPDSLKVLCRVNADSVRTVFIFVLVVFITMLIGAMLFIKRIKMNREVQVQVEIVDSFLED